MSKEYTIKLHRKELTWLHRHLYEGQLKLEGKIKGLNENPQRSEKQDDELGEQIKAKEQVESLCQSLKDRLNNADTQRIKLLAMKEELDEALELVEGDLSNELNVKEKLKELEGHFESLDNFKITFDRASVKFTVRLLDADLDRFRHKIIPAYDKAKEEDFKDPIKTKRYYMNKSRSAKLILEGFKKKLEKGL